MANRCFSPGAFAPPAPATPLWIAGDPCTPASSLHYAAEAGRSIPLAPTPGLRPAPPCPAEAAMRRRRIAWLTRDARSHFSLETATVTLLKTVTVTVLALTVTVTVSGQADRAQTEALAKRAAERLATLQREAEALASQEQTLLVELRKLEVDREIKAEKLAAIETEAAGVQRQLNANTARAAALQGEADRQRPDVEARLVQLYKMGRAGYWRLLLDVDDLRQLGRAYRTAAALGRIDRDRIEEHRRTVAALATERRALEARVSQLKALQARARDARVAVDRAVAARTARVAEIDVRRDLNAQLAGELQQAQQRLQSSVAQMAAGGTVPAVGLPLRPFQGALPWPAEGVVMKRFDRQSGSGMELSLPEGEEIRAVHDGTVAFADQFTGYGNLVIVDHGDRAYSLYGHLATLSVRRGDRVSPSSTVGLAGRNPAGNPSLYFELRVDGKPVDPLQWLKR
jgi:murein hydrolase activator